MNHNRNVKREVERKCLMWKSIAALYYIRSVSEWTIHGGFANQVEVGDLD